MKTRSVVRQGALMLIAAVAACAMTACTEVSPGNITGPTVVIPGDVNVGPIVEQVRPIGDVSGVIHRGIGNVYVQQGGSTSLRVVAGEYVHQYIYTEVVGGNLVIDYTDPAGYRSTEPIEYYLTVPELRRAELDGVGRIVGNGLHTGELTATLGGVGDLEFNGVQVTRLDVSMWGTGRVDVSGTAQDQIVRLDGLGDYHAEGLASTTADVTIHRSSSATVRVSDHLRATIHGSGSVYYIGNPTVDRNGSGSGTVQQI